jgi:hypothetical protein
LVTVRNDVKELVVLPIQLADPLSVKSGSEDEDDRMLHPGLEESSKTLAERMVDQQN